jgi:hypothetical protein
MEFVPTPPVFDEFDYDFTDPEDTSALDTEIDAEAEAEGEGSVAAEGIGNKELAEVPGLPRGLMEAHVEMYLSDEGISREVAEAQGAFSVTERNELPESLRIFWDGPGICFVHHRLDGTKVPQYRPNVPTKRNAKGKVTKYYLPKGSGNRPYYSPLQAHLIGKAPSAWVIEGTKALLSVLTALIAAGRLDDVLLISVAGVWGGSEDGVHSDDFIELVGEHCEVTTFFDADLADNPDVWKAASTLKGFLESIGATVKFARVPVSGKGGVSDYIGKLDRLSPERKLTALFNLVRDAKASPGRKPAAKKSGARTVATTADAEVSAGGAMVFRDLELIAQAYVDDTGKILPGDTLLSCAIWLKSVHEIYDDLTKKATRVGEFDVIIKIGGAEYNLERVPEDRLEDVRWMLAQVPGGAGHTVTMRPRAEKDIAEAIRASSGRAGAELPVRRRLTRSGWYLSEEKTDDGSLVNVTRYVGGNLSIGPKDVSYEVTGEIDEPSFQEYDLENPFDITVSEAREATRAFIRIGDDLVVDKTPVVCGTGYLLFSAAGGTSIGGAVFTGEMGSGKTHLAKALAAMQVKGWEDLANFEGTENFVTGAGKGVQHATVTLDDLRVRHAKNHRSLDSQTEAFEMIMRRIYGGASYAKGRAMWDKNRQETRSKARAKNAPGFLLTAEAAALPDGHRNSNMERALFIPVTEASTFVPGGADEVEAMSKDGVQHKMFVYFLRFIANEIRKKADGSFETWENVNLVDYKLAARTALRGAFPGYKARLYEVSGNALAGYDLFLRFCVAIKVYTPAEAVARYHETVKIVGDAMVLCWKTFQGGAAQRGPLDNLISAVFSGNYWIEGLGDPYQAGSADKRGKLGMLGTTAGESVVWVDPDFAEKITGLKGKALGQSIGLENLVVSPGSYLRKKRLPTGLTSFYAIKRSAWGHFDNKLDSAYFDEDLDGSFEQAA